MEICITFVKCTGMKIKWMKTQLKRAAYVELWVHERWSRQQRTTKKWKKCQQNQSGKGQLSEEETNNNKNMTNFRPGSSAGEWGWGRTRWRPAAGLWCCDVCCAPCWTKATPFCGDCAALERCSPAGHPETSAAHSAKLRIAAAPQQVSLWSFKKRRKY